jgi:hypothetical protein
MFFAKQTYVMVLYKTSTNIWCDVLFPPTYQILAFKPTGPFALVRARAYDSIIQMPVSAVLLPYYASITFGRTTLLCAPPDSSRGCMRPRNSRVAAYCLVLPRCTFRISGTVRSFRGITKLVQWTS